jgi:hypothetical protein
MSKAFGEQNPTEGETAVSWQTFTNGSAVIPDVVGDVDWGKLKLDLLGQEGRSAVYDLGAVATRKFTLTENRYGSGAESATIQIRGDTSAFVQDDVLPAWETYTAPVSKGYRYVQVRATTVALGWWLSGGISAANCIAAYQAKGAASYAASLVNLANPSTYDATTADAPAWAALTGWHFEAGSTYILCGTSVPATTFTYSVICRVFTSSAGGDNSGRLIDQANQYRIIPYTVGNYVAYNCGNTAKEITPSLIGAGTLGMAGRFAFRNGISEGECTGATLTAGDLNIGNSAVYNRGLDGYIYAIALYDTVITDTQMLAVSDAMNLL